MKNLHIETPKWKHPVHQPMIGLINWIHPYHEMFLRYMNHGTERNNNSGLSPEHHTKWKANPPSTVRLH